MVTKLSQARLVYVAWCALQPAVFALLLFIPSLPLRLVLSGAFTAALAVLAILYVEATKAGGRASPIRGELPRRTFRALQGLCPILFLVSVTCYWHAVWKFRYTQDEIALAIYVGNIGLISTAALLLSIRKALANSEMEARR